MGKSDQPDGLNSSCRRSIIELWGSNAVDILEQLLLLRKTAREACPMPLDVAIEAWKKHNLLTTKMANLAGPIVRAVEGKNKEIVRGIKANLTQGVCGDADLLMVCADTIVSRLPSILEAKSGLDQMRSLYAYYRDADKMLKHFEALKAETEVKKPSVAKWANT
jgi:hypothetical protein